MGYDLSTWLIEVLGLFNDIFFAALAVPVFGLFAGLLVLLMAVGLFRLLFSVARRV